MILGLILLALVILSGGTYLIFRHWRLSRDLDTLLWRIDKKDIQWETGHLFPVVGGRSGGFSSGSQASLVRFSTVFAPLVTYRERIFAAKIVHVGQMDQSMRHQLQMVS